MTHTPDYEALYREIIPSVVSIYVTADDHGRRRGAGSGFVYDESHVVTNHHVVGDSAEVELRFSEEDWRVGRVVGSDRYTDLAVVEVEDLPAYATPLSLAEAAPAPGVPVAALGNPMGLEGSISVGVVSGSNRSMPTGNGFTIPDTVQTDAPINPGNSGGPLVTADGEVVGVNRARGGDNIGFAISAAVVARVVPSLVERGHYEHPYLKIRTLDVSPSVARANGLDDTRGVLVVDVARGPSRGLLRESTDTRRINGIDVPVGGDIIVAVDGTPVNSHEGLMRHLLLETKPGHAVELDLLRRGAEVTETVTLAERPHPDRRGRGGTHIPVR
ncbi:S1C family serine protease [Halorarius litoreus]|uniref:S1C family serine protease n=1 Tax=Halorarius litoreus TaxID=2962676 RepID=UPI0020CFCB40|nr:trypsin-like peptidase domain-containing protein [Halorarius litoreus]